MIVYVFRGFFGFFWVGFYCQPCLKVGGPPMDRFLLADMADLVEASLQPRIHEPQDEDMTSIAATKSPAEKVSVNKSANFVAV
jgi:hypothetical protein